MTAHIIPPDADLVSLVTLSKQWELDDALAVRRANRPIGKQIYRDRTERAHRQRMAAAIAFHIEGERHV